MFYEKTQVHPIGGVFASFRRDRHASASDSQYGGHSSAQVLQNAIGPVLHKLYAAWVILRQAAFRSDDNQTCTPQLHCPAVQQWENGGDRGQELV